MVTEHIPYTEYFQDHPVQPSTSTKGSTLNHIPKCQLHTGTGGGGRVWVCGRHRNLSELCCSFSFSARASRVPLPALQIAKPLPAKEASQSL